MNNSRISTDHQAFLDWYQKIHEPFTRYCTTKSYGVIETEDLMQEAILAGLEGFSKLEKKEKLLNYMIGIVNNLLRNKLRRKKFQGNWEEERLNQLEAQAPNPEVALDIHYLLKALETLPTEQQEALLLFEVSGFRIEEIAEIQNASIAAVKTRLHRTRKKLKEMLSEEKRTTTSVSARLAAFVSILF